MKPHTAAAILAVIDAHGMPRTKEKADPVLRAWLRAHDAKIDRWGNYHLSDHTRVKFAERVVRIEKKGPDDKAWYLKNSDSYVNMALTLAVRAAEAAGRSDVLHKSEKTKAMRHAASERGAVKRNEAWKEKSGPGFYVTNNYIGRAAEMGKTRIADHDKPFKELAVAVAFAKDKLAELHGMKFDYLLPVEVVEAESRQVAETPLMQLFGKNAHVWWTNGHMKGSPENPNQMKLPGMAGGRHSTRQTRRDAAYDAILRAKKTGDWDSVERRVESLAKSEKERKDLRALVHLHRVR